MDLKYKAGNQIKITNNTCMHNIPNGTIVTIEYLHKWGFEEVVYSYAVRDEDGDIMLLDDDDCVHAGDSK